MKRTISKYDFTEEFKNMGRDNEFSYKGLQALFDYLQDYEESAGEELELDVIALCCDFTEYNTALEAAEAYGFKKDVDEDDEEEIEEQAIEWLRDNTETIIFDEGVIIQNF